MVSNAPGCIAHILDFVSNCQSRLTSQFRKYKNDCVHSNSLKIALLSSPFQSFYSMKPNIKTRRQITALANKTFRCFRQTNTWILPDTKSVRFRATFLSLFPPLYLISVTIFDKSTPSLASQQSEGLSTREQIWPRARDLSPFVCTHHN